MGSLHQPPNSSQPEEHVLHGGAWKVAYADFVTAMMALFIVLWLLSQTNEELRQEIAEYFRTGAFTGAPSLLGAGSGLLDGRDLDIQGNSLGEESL
jgi:flagellar motor protein MotB